MSAKSEEEQEGPPLGETVEQVPTGPSAKVKLAIEMGPLLVFFLVNAKFGIKVATLPFMVAITAALIASRRLEKRWPVMPLVTAVFVLIFGSLTWYFDDSFFILIKATVVNSIFATILLGALALKRPILREMLGSQIKLEDEGWFKLTRNYGLFFVCLAGLNEVIWRNVHEDDYADYKLWVILPISLLFTASQLPTMLRYAIESEDEEANETA